MGKYLCLWEIDMSRIPEDPKEQMEFFERIQNICKEDFEKGPTKDFGMFLGGHNGYTIEEGTEDEVAMSAMRYCPFVKCTIHQVLSTDQLSEIMNKFKTCCQE